MVLVFQIVAVEHQPRAWIWRNHKEVARIGFGLIFPVVAVDGQLHVQILVNDQRGAVQVACGLGFLPVAVERLRHVQILVDDLKEVAHGDSGQDSLLVAVDLQDLAGIWEDQKVAVHLVYGPTFRAARVDVLQVARIWAKDLKEVVHGDYGQDFLLVAVEPRHLVGIWEYQRAAQAAVGEGFHFVSVDGGVINCYCAVK